MKRAILVFFVITIALVVRGGAYPATIKVTLSPQVEVQPAKPVTLKDIARIDGPKDAIGRIGAMTVASGPMAGKNAAVEASYVRLRIQGESKAKVDVRGPERVQLIGKCLRFAPQTLADLAKQFLVEQLPSDGLTYDVVIDRLPHEVVVAAGSAFELRPRLLNPNVRPGPKSVVVDVVVDQRTAASTSVALTVKAVADVLVTTKTIRQNEALSSENTTWDRRDVSRSQNAITRTDSNVATGWLARRTLMPGALITAADVAAPFAVRRGETVALTVTCGRVTLRTTAQIRQDARQGETVAVRPALAGEDVQATVLGPGAVTIAR